VLRDGGGKQKADPYGPSFRWRHWLNCKDRTEMKNKKEITDYGSVDVRG
jgi:hypothetical protein